VVKRKHESLMSFATLFIKSVHSPPGWSPMVEYTRCYLLAVRTMLFVVYPHVQGQLHGLAEQGCK
jgi:hypothetical protein